MSDMPHVGYFDANRSFSTAEVCRILNDTPEGVIRWARRNRIAVTPGPHFPKVKLDLWFSGRYILMALEQNAGDLNELVGDLFSEKGTENE